MNNSRPKIFAMIPARYGSSRLRLKNLALINQKPLISYAINAAKGTDIFEKIILNSDHLIFSDIAKRHGIDFYKRPEDLGSSEAKSDSVVADFINHFTDAEIVVWVNSIAPLQTSEDIENAVAYFLDENLDSLITVEEKFVHCNFKKEPVNYSKNEMFLQTQLLEPIHPFIYSIMMWRTKKFMDDFKRYGYALFCGKFDTYPVNKERSIIIKDKSDLLLADTLMKISAGDMDYEVQYDQTVMKFLK